MRLPPLDCQTFLRPWRRRAEVDVIDLLLKLLSAYVNNIMNPSLFSGKNKPPFLEFYKKDNLNFELSDLLLRIGNWIKNQTCYYGTGQLFSDSPFSSQFYQRVWMEILHDSITVHNDLSNCSIKWWPIFKIISL